MNNVSFAGGSLDVYKRIPEHVLGRIAVAVSLDEILCLSISILSEKLSKQEGLFSGVLRPPRPLSV